MRVLVLGGTAEARAVAALLLDAGHDVTSSLAGRVTNPRLPVGRVRIGGFGGPAGLAEHLRTERVDAVVDATHPFAVRMSAHAVQAAAEVGVDVVRLARPGWGDHPLAHTWSWVDDYDAARETAQRLGGRPFLTTGRQTLPHFAAWRERPVLVRVVEPLGVDAPPTWTVVRDRGPYDVAGETALLREHGVDVLLTKDSGGAYTSAKLDAAHRLGVAVVVVRRPAAPAATATASTPEQAAAAIVTRSSSRTA